MEEKCLAKMIDRCKNFRTDDGSSFSGVMLVVAGCCCHCISHITLEKAAAKSKSPALMRSYRKASNAANTLNTQLKKKY